MELEELGLWPQPNYGDVAAEILQLDNRQISRMSDAPDCSPDGPVNLADDEQQPTEEVGVVGDTNLGVVMLALLVMGLINYSMRDPCTC